MSTDDAHQDSRDGETRQRAGEAGDLWGDPSLALLEQRCEFGICTAAAEQVARTPAGEAVPTCRLHAGPASDWETVRGTLALEFLPIAGMTQPLPPRRWQGLQR